MLIVLLHKFLHQQKVLAVSLCMDTASATDPTNHGSTSSQWFGYKVVGDNVDKKVKPRHMRSDNQSKDLHYFHLYAAKDRIDFSEASEEPPSLRLRWGVCIRPNLPAS